MTRGEWLARGLAGLEWPLIDSPWDVSSLMLHREGDWYGIWLSFLASGEHWGWYVNFQEPYRRTEHGIQTMDMALDIIVEPDRSSWRWKDEDEFALLLDHGVIDAAAAARVRGEADRVIGLIERDEPPFDSAWPRWKPDPAWGRPGLPEGWEIV
jgi:predicted RNA-binding protein associated with RNAse of E/G family